MSFSRCVYRTPKIDLGRGRIFESNFLLSTASEGASLIFGSSSFQSSGWGNISAGVPQGSILGPLFFLIYINDLSQNLRCSVKLFADDTSLFIIVKDTRAAATDMNHDLDLIRLWAQKWRMKV